MTEPAVPEGFTRHFRRSGLTDPWEPIYSRRAPGAVVIGLRAADSHANSRGFVHGGLISALADNAMGLSCVEAMQANGKPAAGGLVTVTLNLDFIGSAQVGSWLAFDTGYVKIGGALCFAQCFVTADGEVCARANATFRIVRPRTT